MIDYTKFLKRNYFPIFLFHGVSNNKFNYKIRNYNRKHIDKDYFYKVCSQLSKVGNALSMDQVYEIIINKKKIPKNSFAITFDDGFYNNYNIAAPILRDLNLPTTFYVTTNFIDQNYMSWIDIIEKGLEKKSKDKICLPWGIFKVKSNKDKIVFLKKIRAVIKSNPKYNPDLITKTIINQLGNDVKYSSNSEIDKKMNWQNIKKLNSEKIFTIAPHTHNHRILSFCNQKDLNFEISKSISLLKNKGEVSNFHYAYPDGQINHYNSFVISALKKEGVKCCPTAITGMNNIKTDPFDLKRIMVI